MEPEQIGAFEAKTRLSELLEQVSRGKTYRITRRGKVIAELRPAGGGDRRPTFGADRGRITVSADFDAPLPDFKGYK
jgi:prevent-host-death family protein